MSAMMFLGTTLASASLVLLSLKAVPSFLSCDKVGDPCSCSYSLVREDGYCDMSNNNNNNSNNNNNDDDDIDSLFNITALPKYYQQDKVDKENEALMERIQFLVVGIFGFGTVLFFLRFGHAKYRDYMEHSEFLRMERAVEKKEIDNTQQELIKQIMVKQMTHAAEASSSPHGKKDALSRLQIPADRVYVAERAKRSRLFEHPQGQPRGMIELHALE